MKKNDQATQCNYQCQWALLIQSRITHLRRIEKVLEHAHDKKAVVAARARVDEDDEGCSARRR